MFIDIPKHDTRLSWQVCYNTDLMLMYLKLY